MKILEFKEYNSKIVSADKAEREEGLKLNQFYLGFHPTVDTALIPPSITLVSAQPSEPTDPA